MGKLEVKELLEAGVHFGHLTRKWNPNMAPFIYMERNGIHIINLYKTVAKIEEASEALKKIALIGLSSWGWFEFNQARKNIMQNIKRVSTIVRSIPNLEQGIYFSKRLYFSVGGMGVFDSSPFSEISKRFYSRIDPQKPLPALIIRTKNLNLD